jgi:four helix bundle protein
MANGQAPPGGFVKNQPRKTSMTNVKRICYKIFNRSKETYMAKYQHFEDLPVWQEAARLYNLVLDLLEEPNLPLTSGFRSQLDRASLSISNNIAEGFERSTTNELRSFIAISRGSAGEVRSMTAVVKNRPKLKPLSGGTSENPEPCRFVRTATHRMVRRS